MSNEEPVPLPEGGSSSGQASMRLTLVIFGLCLWIGLAFVQTGSSTIAALAFNLAVLITLFLASSLTRTVSAVQLASLFFAGGVAMGVAGLLGKTIGLQPNQWANELITAFVEDVVRLAPLAVTLFISRRFSIWTWCATDLILLGAASGAGFAFIEDAFAHRNMNWVGQVPWCPTMMMLDGRLIAGHLFWSALAGAGLGLGLLLRSRGKLALYIPIILIAVTMIDHFALHMWTARRDLLSSTFNFVVGYGYAVPLLFVVAFVAAQSAELAILKQAWRRFVELRVHKVKIGIMALWQFVLDARRFSYALFQAENARHGPDANLALTVATFAELLHEVREPPREPGKIWDTATASDRTLAVTRAAAGGVAMSPTDTYGSIGEFDLPDRYQLLEPISQGGMGIIYRAQHAHTGAKLAIKVMHSHVAKQAIGLERFKREAKAASALNHPNLVVVHDFGTTQNNIAYLVMDLIPGASLKEEIARQGRLSLDSFYTIFDQVCLALAHAHKRMVVHRDLKPSNILITKTDDDRDFVKIVDFGIAKDISSEGLATLELTKTGDLVGSPLYMSPEQAMGSDVDSRSDIYSLGCVMYEALTGTPPFIGNNAVQTIFKHASEHAAPMRMVQPDIELPEGLESIIMKTLAKDPEDRYASMEELRIALAGTKLNSFKITRTRRLDQF